MIFNLCVEIVHYICVVQNISGCSVLLLNLCQLAGWLRSAVLLILIVHVFSVIAVAVDVVLVAPRHVFTMFEHHVHELQLVSGVLVELDIDEAALCQHVLNSMLSHAHAAK